MKKKITVVIGVVVGLLLLATLIGPSLILKADRQEAKADEYAYSEVFFDEYDEVRAHFLDTVKAFEDAGVEHELYSYEIAQEEGLYIDTLYLPSKEEQTNLVVLTTGVHGIEGYIGSVMLDVFWQEVYPEIDVDNTGILVIANINPYGMKYHRRYN